MNMDYSVFWVFIKEAIQCSEIRLTPWHKARQTVDFSAHRLNFIVVCCTFLTMYQKIELNLLPVDIAVVIHEHGL